VLALSPIPPEGAGCRFRVSQFIPYLEANGFDVTLSTLYTNDFFRLVYQPGHYVEKTGRFASLAVRHVLSLVGARNYDVIFLYRELLPVGPAILEPLLSMMAPPIVFDFDDAIFLGNVSDANRFIASLKFPNKMATIVRRAAHVIAGNEFLASYARRYNDAVTVIPTSVDTNRFVPRGPAHAARAPLTIGWIGSPTTAPFLRVLAEPLRAVAERHPFTFRVSGATDPIAMPGVAIDAPRWSMADEVSLFNTCDIGVYPLPHDDWSRGKCGFKAIQFMACGVPVVASPVGVNLEIIQDGVNGFLAADVREWADKIERLLADPDLRARFGAAGRRTIQERYDLAVNAPAIASVLRDAAASGADRSNRRAG
jgi:glycosyltransferase involved in cell wall biosynthesis